MKVLLVVDVQKQFQKKGYSECLEYISRHREDYDMVVATLFVNDKKVNGNFIRKLKWKDCKDASPYDLEFKADQIVVKNGYGFPSSYFSPKDEIDVIGCETDACVLATCFDLWDDGLNFKVLWGYVYPKPNRELRKIYSRNFGL